MSTSDQAENVAHYHSYLVRLWREPSHVGWRASVRSIQTGEEQQFAHLEQLFLFLHTQTADSPPIPSGGCER